MAKKDSTERLELWQRRLSKNAQEYEAEVSKMDHREDLYRGTHDMFNAHTGETQLREATHVRNIVAELIEAQVDTNIPQPKVTAKRKEDEHLARVIEDMLRGELDRLRFEEMNDMQERTVPIQGGGLWLVEWDNSERSHNVVGDVCVSLLHPKQIVPQAGVYTGIEDMDYIILKIPQTKEYIRRKYRVDVSDESEEEAGIKGSSDESAAEDMVTQYVAYYRNDSGGIGLFSWVRDTVLEDLDDYQSRRLRRCKKCGAVEPAGAPPAEGSQNPDADKKRKHVCPVCGGSSWEERTEEFEEIFEDKPLPDGRVIPGGTPHFDELGNVTIEPTKIPFYKPDIFPVVLQKNVSMFGKFLGDSDVDKIEDQQNTLKWLYTSMNDKTMKYGSYLTLPRDAKIGADDKEGKVIRMDKPDWISMITVRDMNVDIEQDLVYAENIYEQARQVIGITDSFQGRRDTTATSGTAKQFAAQQSAGRLESKRIMKHAAYSHLFESIFKFKLAYSDEPRPVSREAMDGEREYGEFDRYLFLRQDAAGEWYWNDDFLFSCDTAASLATNRESLWQEARLNLQTGAYGNAQDYGTLTLFWGLMEKFHYPYADAALKYVQQLAEKAQAQAEQQQQLLQQQQEAAQSREDEQLDRENRRADEEAQAAAQSEAEAAERQLEIETIRQAQADARADVNAMRGGAGIAR